MRHAFSFIRTIKDSFILIFLDIINASPFWIRQMTAITAPQLGVSKLTGAGYKMPQIVL